MKKITRIILATLLLAVCTLTFFSCRPKTVWETDLEVVKQQTRELNKDMLIFFSGNDWDGISPNLMANYLSTNKFMNAARKEFVLFSVDVPSDVSTLSDSDYANIMVMTGLCKVNTCPAIIICDEDGAPYYEITYQEGITTLDDLVQEVKAVSETKRLIEKLEKELETVLGPERVEVIDELVSCVSEAYVSRYYELLCTIPMIDPGNKSGLVGKYTLVAAEQRASSRLLDGDPYGALEEFAACADSTYLSIAQKQECLYYAAYFAVQMEEWEYAIDYMEKAYVLSPDSETGKIIGEMLPQMRASLQQEQAAEEE